MEITLAFAPAPGQELSLAVDVANPLEEPASAAGSCGESRLRVSYLLATREASQKAMCISKVLIGLRNTEVKS